MANEPFISLVVQGLTPALLNNEAWVHSSLEQLVGMALEDSLGRLQDQASIIAFDRFKHQSFTHLGHRDLTGNLESHFSGEVTSWSFPTISGDMFNDVAYARRRNWGFSGMTDSLGRHFTNDPGVYYMEGTVTAETDWIISRFKKAVSQALAEFAASGPTSGTGGTP